MNPTTLPTVRTGAGIYVPKPAAARRAWVGSLAEYRALYRHSVKHPHDFWAGMAGKFHWFQGWESVRSFDFEQGHIEWFKGGKTNMSVNCLDRHVDEGRGDQTAILFEGNAPGEVRTYSYKRLLGEVSKFANVLKEQGVGRGDTVTIYMPMIPELAVTMLACSRIGAVHSIVFGAFSAEKLKDRILDAKSSVLITANGYHRGSKYTDMKRHADEAMMLSEEAGNPIASCIVCENTGETVHMRGGRDLWMHELMAKASDICPPEHMDAEDPLFILYTSGSTGQPKGVMHTTGGYMVYAGTTFKYVFDYHRGDVYWCTADIGWITGHSYIVYGPLSQGATSVMFEGVPTYPDPGRFWDVVQRHGVNQFYTAPTAIRALMAKGDEWPAKYDLSSLKVLGTVGEPINPAAWEWYHNHIGGGTTPIVDTYWQTETGGIIMTPLPGATPTKPGSATLPFFGVEPAIVNEKGAELMAEKGDVEGILVMKGSWPGQARTIWGDHDRFVKTYYAMFPGKYFTGDGARRDDDGYYWVTGRVDDVINVSGHRLGTAEVESALVRHKAVAEAAVVGFPHDIKGQGIYAFVTLMGDIEASDALRRELIQEVRDHIGPIATPDVIQFAPQLPKTRSGKIMRRLLRKVAEGEEDREKFGDTSTLSDSSVVDALLESRRV